MEERVHVSLLGKQYVVPAELTIMDAMEYAGFKLVRGCGCRIGFCGACAVVYRMAGKTEIKVALACQTKVEEGMCVGRLESYPVNKRRYDVNALSRDENIVGHLYPEIYSCIGCNTCTKGCPQGLNVMQYIAAAQRGDYRKVAELSFDCVGCNICASRCPAQITHSAVGLLARRLTAKYIEPPCAHLESRVREIRDGVFHAGLEQLKRTPVDELRQRYNERVIEK